MKATRTATTTLAAVALAVTLGACQSDTPTTSADADDQCSTSTPAQAARDAAAKVAPYPGPDGQKWKYVSTGAVNGWDRCAGLSWIALPLEGGTASSPWQIALFRHGKYIGTATAEGQGFEPTITRTSDTGIKVVYAWPKEQDANAFPTGRSTAYFTWDDARHAVTMTGSIPPSSPVG